LPYFFDIVNLLHHRIYRCPVSIRIKRKTVKFISSLNHPRRCTKVPLGRDESGLHNALLVRVSKFDCLTAALLGGVSFKGGEGTIFGLMVGIIIIGVLNNAMQLAQFPDFSQTVVKGAVLLIAVTFDVYQKNRKAKETVARVAA
jgi:hypothetical protein